MVEQECSSAGRILPQQAQSPGLSHKLGLLEASLSYIRPDLNKQKPSKDKISGKHEAQNDGRQWGEWPSKGDDARADLSNTVIKGDACPTPAQGTHLPGHRVEQTLKACQMTGCPGNPAASLGRPRVAVRVEQGSSLSWRLGKWVRWGSGLQ